MESAKNKLLLIIGIISIIALYSFSYYFLIYRTTDYGIQVNSIKIEK